MQVKERIAKLREAMSKSGLDGYLVPTADFHESEYVGAHFKARAWLSGFQGSAGTLLVEKESARLKDRRCRKASRSSPANIPQRSAWMPYRGIPQ